jgi:hypothetical protein
MSYAVTGFKWGVESVIIEPHGADTSPLWGEIDFISLAADDALSYVESAEVKIDGETVPFEFANEMFGGGHGIVSGECSIVLTCQAGYLENIVYALGRTADVNRSIDLGASETFDTVGPGAIVPGLVSVMINSKNPHDTSFTDRVYAPRCQAKGNLGSLLFSRKEKRTVDIELMCYSSQQRAVGGDPTLDMSTDNNTTAGLNIGMPLIICHQTA